MNISTLPTQPTLSTQRDGFNGEWALQHEPHLFLSLECDRPHAGSARYSLSHIDEVRIGRGQRRQATRTVEAGRRVLSLRVPDRRMSARHANIVLDGDGARLADAGSTNGSFLAGRRVRTATLRDRDLIELGRTFFVFCATLPTPEHEPGDLDSCELSSHAPGCATLLPELRAGMERLLTIARSAIPVLLLGDTGTGKELIARAVHQTSGRTGPFVPVNCGALPPTLLEAQLFGHVRGAFSGAHRDEPGYLRRAHHGTLFLDEIGDLPHDSQVALLRALQEQEVVPVGTTSAISVDLRVVCATHVPLEARAARGEFRQDLLARIAGFTFQLPPLSERKGELGLLLAAILAELGRADSAVVSPAAGHILLSHDWPHNLRGLHQAIASALVLAGSDPILPQHLPASLARPVDDTADAEAPARLTDEELEEKLLRLFETHQGNVSQVARSMGKARVQVQRWVKRFGIDPSAYR